MDDHLDFGLVPLPPKAEADTLLAVNMASASFGLTLSPPEALALVEEKNRVLRSMGRIELSGDVLAKLAEAFSPSQYISAPDYFTTLHELVRIFYYCRGEFALDILDDDLIDWMLEMFEGPCRGSLDLLEGKMLDEKLRGYRGQEDDRPEAPDPEDEPYEE